MIPGIRKTRENEGINKGEAKEIAQKTRAPAAPAEEWGSIPSTHTASHNNMQFQFQVILCPLLASKGTSCNQPHIRIK